MEQERMELWNVKDLQPPPLLRCRSPLTQIELDILTTSLKEGIEYFSNQPYLHREAALLSRIIYRMKTKFRSSKDFKILEKINNALLNYLQMNITQTLKAFAASVSVKSKVVGTFLPTRNIFDYVLIRFQGLGKLLIRIIECCKIACEMHNQRMRLGHFWKIAILIYGLSSRIFIICKNMIKFTCNLYTKLFSLRSKFANVGVKWLPNNYVQPKSLNEWLGISWEELEKTVIIEIPDEPFRIISYFNLIDDDSDFDDDIQISDEYILVKDDTSNNEDNNKDDDTGEIKNITTLRGFDEDVDIGEVLTLSDTDNGEVESNNNTLTEQDKEATQQLSNGKSQNTTTKSAKKRVVKIIKRKKVGNKQESVINLDDSNEENLDDSVIFVGSSKPIETHSNNGSPSKKKLKKRKADQNCIGEPEPKKIKKKKRNGVKSKGNSQQQQENSTIKQTKKKKKKIKKINKNP